MATFKAEVYEHHKKADGSYNVKIRVTHKKKKRYLATSVYVFKDDMTRSLKIKDQDTIDKLDAMVKQYYNDIKELAGSIDYMSVGDIVGFILQKDEERLKKKKPEVEFYAYLDILVERMKAEGRDSTASNYVIMKNSLIRFIGNSLNFSDINVSFLEKYENHLKNSTTGPRGLSLYMGLIRATFNAAIRELNDYENDKIIIKGNPFSKYKIPAEPPVPKRAISLDAIYKIKKLPDTNLHRENFAKDVFLLSFYLCGMNAADMYYCEPDSYKEGRLTYYRRKTKSRRKDNAKISVLVPLIAKQLFNKYRDPFGKRLFVFNQMYSTPNTFTQALNKGAKLFGKKAGAEGLEFYAARHTFASIARNKCNLPMDYISKALNHTDTSHSTTDLYIEEDWSIVDRVQKAVIDKVIKHKPLIEK